MLSSLLGFVIALALFFVLFLTGRAREGIVRTLILTAAGIAFIVAMADALNREFPPGLLQEYIELPWPLRGR